MRNDVNQTMMSTKKLNKRLILNCIRSHPLIYRSTISKKLNLSKPTVSALVDELIEEGWINELDKTEDHLKVGRKPIQLSFNEKAGFVVGVDIGGSGVEIALSDLNGTIYDQRVIDTQASLQVGLLHVIHDTVHLILKDARISAGEVLGMGIGVPGIVNVEEGIVIDAPSLDWINYPLKKEAETLFDWKVLIDNDVNVSVLGEQWLGRARNKSNVILLSIGTGIGCGILLNGNLYRGCKWGAGEVGYMITDKERAFNAYTKPFKGYGFLDSQLGGPALVEKMKFKLKQHPEHPFYGHEVITAKDIFTYAKKDDALALEVIDEFISDLSAAIINITSLLNPEIILLGGGISKSGDWFISKLKAKVKEYVPFEVNIEIAELDERIGVLGAITLFLKENESVIKI
ncbi:Glucokinase [Lentibacillus sp. JNUCC-1]|uniref:ROK family transcriptional regulator n=1 Tax=Lentibacillus sp. JNUCC-1 TaxID=2654513 RepID=UPI0012E98290|nr:ROK family transcriptional regulator [Lentibacillus sp. JNUCC-1]MUV37047.1 Glucokinase [Lentibacillus sp. JNUCC-1]